MNDFRAPTKQKPTTPTNPKSAPPRVTISPDQVPLRDQVSLPDQVSLHDRIRARAYELYESRGREHGKHEQDWLTAEQEIRTHQR